MLTPQFKLALHSELVIDLFAGGGGASTGIEQAIGRPVDIAINHDPEAVALHQANHPQTLHYVSDVFEVDPEAVVDGRPVGMLWASPDCKHFSKAKGGKPVSKRIRGLAWVVIKWAKLVRPRVIFLENVEEFQHWGPLGPDDKPCQLRKGRTFKRWKSSLANLGYTVDWREDRASDMGAPTIRKRLFLVARCDGNPIVFPEATHGAPDSLGVKAKKLKPFRTAADCMQWDIGAPSIFERTRELADATKRRIAKGIMRYVVNAANPFIVPMTHQGGDRVEDITKPMNTVTGAHPGEKALVVPTLVQTGYGERDGQAPRALDLHKPLGTVVAGQKHALVTAFLNEHANASNQRTMPIDEPMRTQMAEVKGGHFSVVAASLVKHYTGVVGSEMVDPVGTVTSVDHHSLLTANLVHYHADKRPEDVRASDMRDPLKTQTTENRHGLVTATIVNTANSKTTGRGPNTWPAEEPMRTVTSAGGQALVTAHIQRDMGQSVGHPADAPLGTVMPGGGGKAALVTAALVGVGGRAGQSRPRGAEEPIATVTSKYDTGLVTANLVHMGHGEGADGTKRWSDGTRDIADPLNTITASSVPAALVTGNLIKLRGTSKEGQSFEEPLHTVSAQGTHHAEVLAFLIKYYGVDQDPRLEEPMHTVTTRDRFGLVTVKGQSYQIVDIGLRMLTPRELYRAQGFPENYQIERGGDGRVLTKTAQVRMCGNSVCPPMARAYVAANYTEAVNERIAA